MHKKSLLLLVVAIFVSSCASSRRLKRVFRESGYENKLDEKRVNTFPLLESSKARTTVLWPLIDIDKEGFSIRPFFNKEGSEYSLLFPLIAWNPVLKDGWVGPYVWNKDYQALFPLYYKNNDFLLSPLFYKDHDTMVLLNYYQNKNNYGMFPLFYGNKDNFFTWFYYWEKTKNSSKHSYLFNLLGRWENKNNGDYSHYLFPWLSTKNNDKKLKSLLPLFWSFEDKHKSGSTIFPLYYASSKGENSTFRSLLGGYSKNADSSSINVTPFWWSGKDKNRSYQTLFPLYFHNENKNSSSTYLLPWYSRSSPRTSLKRLFPLFYTYTENDKDGDLKENKWCVPSVLPLVSSSTTKERSRTKGLFGALYNNEREGTKAHGSVLGWLADWKSDTEEGSSRFRFPGIWNWDGLIGTSSNTKEETSSVNFLLYKSETKKDITRRNIFPFITLDSGKNSSDFSFLYKVFETHRKNGKKGGHFFFIPWGNQD